VVSFSICRCYFQVALSTCVVLTVWALLQVIVFSRALERYFQVALSVRVVSNSSRASQVIGGLLRSGSWLLPGGAVERGGVEDFVGIPGHG